MNRCLTEEQISNRVAEVATRINEDYSDRPLVVLGVLNGAFMFTSDLVRHLSMHTEVGFVKVTSYDGRVSSGEVIIESSPSISIKGRDILVVEDIVDTGSTVTILNEYLKSEGAASIAFCAFAVKHAEHEIPTEIPIKYECFLVPSHLFYVGYGMDYNEQYRNLPELYSL